MELIKQKHLIIGSNSFLGRTLCKKLYHDKIDVTGVFNENKTNLLTTIPQVQIEDIFKRDNNFHVVYIISAYIPSSNIEDKTTKALLQAVNVDLVSKICKYFNKSRIVFCSSVSVYEPNVNVITEETIPKPISTYGWSKLKAEDIVSQQNSFAILRISSMFGKLMKSNTFLPAIINKALKTNKITLFGLGERQQNYIPVSLVANYLFQAGFSIKNDTYLATYNDSFSNKNMALKVKRYLPEIEINFEGEDHSKSYIYDNSYTNKQLKFTNEVNFNEEIKALIAWMKKES